MAQIDSQQAIREAVRRIVEGFAPEQVILFGSHARQKRGHGRKGDTAEKGTRQKRGQIYLRGKRVVIDCGGVENKSVPFFSASPFSLRGKRVVIDCGGVENKSVPFFSENKSVPFFSTYCAD